MKPAAMAAPVAGAVKQSGDVPSSVLLNPDLKSFLPFVSKGHVSLVGSHYKVPVMLRDTAAFDSFIVGSTLPFSDETDTSSFVPVRGMGMSVFRVPLHKLVLHSDLSSGVVKMGVRPALPVEGIQVILGNDVAGGRVWPDQPAHPLVVPVLLGTCGPDENETRFPEVFKACAVTRMMMRAGSDAGGVDRSEQKVLVAESLISHLSNCPFSVSHSELVKEQKADSTLAELFQSVRPVGEVKNLAQGYFIEKGVLLRKWVPHGEGFMGEPVYQVVIPSKFCEVVLRVAHVESGHMGVTKAYDRILRHFFLAAC